LFFIIGCGAEVVGSMSGLEEELADDQLGFGDIFPLQCNRIRMVPLDGEAEEKLDALREAIGNSNAKHHYRLLYLGRIADGPVYELVPELIGVFRLPCGYLVNFPDWGSGDIHFTDQHFVRSERDVALIALRRLASEHRELYRDAGEVARMIHAGRIVVWLESGV